jgi:putative redox protein
MENRRNSLMTEVIVSSIGYLKQQITAGEHTLIADEPREAGGSDAGPDPYSFLVAALGACTAMTLQIYARRKERPLEKVEVSLRHSRIHAEDCGDCAATQGEDRSARAVHLALGTAQRRAESSIARDCPAMPGPQDTHV